MVQIPITGSSPAAQVGRPAAIAEAESLLDESHEILDPMTGEIIDDRDIDAMIDLYERRKIVSDQVYAVMLRIRTALAALTEGDAKSRRVQGKKRRAAITMPDDGWEQPLLKEAFNAYPQYRDQVLKIDSIGVKLREYKKLTNTTGDESFNQFRDMVTRANRGPSGTPTVKVEV